MPESAFLLLRNQLHHIFKRTETRQIQIEQADAGEKSYLLFLLMIPAIVYRDPKSQFLMTCDSRKINSKCCEKELCRAYTDSLCGRLAGAKQFSVHKMPESFTAKQFLSRIAAHIIWREKRISDNVTVGAPECLIRS